MYVSYYGKGENNWCTLSRLPSLVSCPPVWAILGENAWQGIAALMLCFVFVLSVSWVAYSSSTFSTSVVAASSGLGTEQQSCCVNKVLNLHLDSKRRSVCSVMSRLSPTSCCAWQNLLRVRGSLRLCLPPPPPRADTMLFTHVAVHCCYTALLFVAVLGCVQSRSLFSIF